jgi:hypothetical protein
MSVTITQTRLGPTTILFQWSSTLSEPTYYVYLDGNLIDVTTRTYRVIDLAPYESVQIEVTDDPEETPADAWPGRLILSWYPVTNALKYQIREYSDGEWTDRATVIARGEAIFRWTTPPLADVTQHQWRVVPVGDNNLEGNPLEYDVYMVRRPTPPDLALTYDDQTGVVTVSE